MRDFVSEIRWPDGDETAELSEEVRDALSKAMELVVVHPSQPLFLQGEEGDAMYVVVSGEMGMYINPAGRPTPPIQEEEQTEGNVNLTASSDPVRTESLPGLPTMTREVTPYLTEISNEDCESADEGPDFQRRTHQVYGSKVYIATPGDAFGELSLVSDEPRAATAIAHGTGCQLAYLSRASWQKTLRTVMHQKQERKMETIRALPAFAKLDRALLRRLSYSFKPQEIPRRTLLMKQGLPANNVYLIYSGEVLTKIVLDDRSQASISSILGSGELIGAYLGSQQQDSERALFTAVTVTNCKVLVIPRSVLLERFPIQVRSKCQETMKSKMRAWLRRGAFKLHLLQSSADVAAFPVATEGGAAPRRCVPKMDKMDRGSSPFGSTPTSTHSMVHQVAHDASSDDGLMVFTNSDIERCSRIRPCESAQGFAWDSASWQYVPEVAMWQQRMGQVAGDASRSRVRRHRCLYDHMYHSSAPPRVISLVAESPRTPRGRGREAAGTTGRMTQSARASGSCVNRPRDLPRMPASARTMTSASTCPQNWTGSLPSPRRPYSMTPPRSYTSSKAPSTYFN
eukprot:scaffold74439_cov32-Tisochrysis_lutea.AAC.2